MTRREMVAEDLARRSGVGFGEYPYGSKPRGGVTTKLDALRRIEDDGLRRKAWDLYWLLEAERVEHNYRLPGENEEERERYP